MPKTLPERIFFTIVMAAIMVYGMIVYNVALNTGGVTNATFVMALHEMPIMVPIACVLEFFVVEKLATGLAFMFMRPTDRPQFITYAISLMIVCIMCPVMSLIATVLFKEPGFGTWVHTWGCNMPMALCWQMLCARQGGLPRKSRRKADAVLRAACPCHLPAGVPPRCKTGGLTDFRYAVIINMYRSGCNPRRDTYTNFIYRAYKVCTMGHF